MSIDARPKPALAAASAAAPDPSEDPARFAAHRRFALTRHARTFAGAFRSAFLINLRGYTLTGWTVATILSPLFLLGSAYVILNFISPGGGAPARFVALTGHDDYLAFAAIGLAFNGLAVSALDDGGSAIYDEERQGTWDILALAPFPRFTWMLAKMSAGLLSSAIDFVVILVLASLIVDVSFTPLALAVATVGVFLTILGLLGFAYLMAAVGLRWKEPHAIAVLLSPVLILISGMMIPVQALPGWVQPISYSFPLTYGLEIVRGALLLDQGFAPLASAFLGLILSGAAFMAVGFGAFKLMERHALRSGSLGRY